MRMESGCDLAASCDAEQRCHATSLNSGVILRVILHRTTGITARLFDEAPFITKKEVYFPTDILRS